MSILQNCLASTEVDFNIDIFDSTHQDQTVQLHSLIWVYAVHLLGDTFSPEMAKLSQNLQ